jgi:hypothetical protein
MIGLPEILAFTCGLVCVWGIFQAVDWGRG